MELHWRIILTVFLLIYTSTTSELLQEINFSSISESMIMPTTTTPYVKHKIPATTQSTSSSICHKLKGLSSGQIKHCHLYEDHMEFVNDSLKNSLQECQWQFRHHRWNCTILSSKQTFFAPILKFGHKEAAFVQAITTAGIMHGIARTCRDGQLTRCGCSTIARPTDLSKEWIWKGCGDNLEYGYKFTRNFIDIKEREKMHRKKKEEKEYGRALMTLHNYEAGRRAVLKMTRISCKCHGVSGSCSLITCWHQLPAFREIGDYVKEKYLKAIKVKVNKKMRLQINDSTARKPTVTDLVYVQQSPTYCERNITLGILGVENRECNKTSQSEGSCDVLCCDRSHNTRKVMVKEKCNCMFHWCCYVKCESCVKVKDIYSCN